MKYCVENNLSLFEFHDSDFLLLDFNETELVVLAKHLNIHKYTEQNPSEWDMEIECAQITFSGFRAPSYEPGREWKVNDNGQSYPVGPCVKFSGEEAAQRILGELKSGIWVYHFEKNDYGYSLGGSGKEPYFTIEFDFDRILIEWDSYKKKAWYETRHSDEK